MPTKHSSSHSQKSVSTIGTSTIAAIFVVVLLFFFLLLPFQDEITAFSIRYPVLAPVLLIIWRCIGVIIPPLPAGVFAVGMIPILGWFVVYLYSTIGLLLGACIAFFIARRFREPIVKKFVSLQALSRWENKLSEEKELWGFILVRMTTQPIMDFMSYLAGLSSIPFWKFFVATVLSLIPGAFSYYLLEKTYHTVIEENPFVSLGSFLGVLVVVFIFNQWYAQKKKK